MVTSGPARRGQELAREGPKALAGAGPRWQRRKSRLAQDARPEVTGRASGSLVIWACARRYGQWYSHVMILGGSSSQLKDTVVRKREFEAAHPEVTIEFDQGCGLHVARFPGPDGPRELRRFWLGKLLNDLGCLFPADR